MGFQKDVYGISFGFLWCFCGISMAFLWDVHDISFGFLWYFYEITIVFFSMLFLEGFFGNSMGCP